MGKIVHQPKEQRRGGARDEAIFNISYTAQQLARLYNRMNRQLGVNFGPTAGVRKGRRRPKRTPATALCTPTAQ